MRPRSLRWWSWLTAVALLATSLAGWQPGLALAIASVAIQLAQCAARGSLSAFPAQVRVAYLGILAVGAWPPLGFIHWLQLAGTVSSVVFDYCPLARAVSLMPWNRTRPLTLAQVRRTFATGPVRGSVLDALER